MRANLQTNAVVLAAALLFTGCSDATGAAGSSGAAGANGSPGAGVEIENLRVLDGCRK